MPENTQHANVTNHVSCTGKHVSRCASSTLPPIYSLPYRLQKDKHIFFNIFKVKRIEKKTIKINIVPLTTSCSPTIFTSIVGYKKLHQWEF